MGLVMICVGGGLSASASAGERGVHSAREWVERESLIMGTRLHLRVSASDRPAGIAAIEDAVKGAILYESVLSSWTDDSEVGLVNRADPERVVPLSPILTDALREALHWSEQTSRAFEPVIGALVDAWDVRGAGRVPSEEELSHALASTGTAGISFDASQATAQRLSPLAWIDSGGFGKGAALAAIRTSLAEHGIHDAFVDFGGQVVAMGSSEIAPRGWRVRVAHPERRFSPTKSLSVTGVSVATSGGSERVRRLGGREVSHVLDPRTGQPIAPWGSVTVVSRDPLAADAIATALFVLGPEAALEWARTREDVGVLVSTAEVGGEVREGWNQAMEAWFDPSANLWVGSG